MFSLIVNLYRTLNRPQVREGVFEFDGNVLPETLALIEEVNALPAHFGTFNRLNINEGIVELEFSLPATGYGRFHPSLEAMLSITRSLDWGIIPSDYYIVDIDYFSLDPIRPTDVTKLFEMCEFVTLLKKLSGDSSAYTPNSPNKLTFVLVANDKMPAKTFSLTIRLTHKALRQPIIHLNLLRALMSDERKNQIHIEERQALMRLAIAEIIDSLEINLKIFENLVAAWPQILNKYRYNVMTFVHQFSFEKTRKDIANAQIEYSSKLSATLGDIAGKLLALPLSFAGLLLLRNTRSVEEFVIYSLALLVASCTVIGILINQWAQIERLDQSFSIVFSQYNDKLPAKLWHPIRESQLLLKKQRIVLFKTFLAFGFFACIPVCGVVWYWFSHILMIPYFSWFFGASIFPQ